MVEVLSPNDRTRDTLQRVTEFLNAGVQVVAVFNPRTGVMMQYRQDGEVEVFGADDLWTVPELLPGFSVRVAELAG